MWTEKCAAMHLDVWCAKTDVIQSMVSMIRDGVIKADMNRTTRDYKGVKYPVVDGIAVISLDGPLMKAWSKYGGTSTTWARGAIRNADIDPQIKGIMLHIDSPGGTGAGTAELGDTIRQTAKPIHAHIDDLGASAAYWAASQANHISINRTGLSGSIGTYVSISDTSGKAEMEGVKVHVIATGGYKGAGTEGAEVTEEHLAYWQEIVNSHFAHFENAVRGGRRMLKAQFNKVSDGRVFDAEASKAMGLVDHIESFETAMMRLKRQC